MRFERIRAEDLTPESLAYLRAANERTPSNTTPLEAVLALAGEYGDLFHVIDDEIIGVVYLMTYLKGDTKVLSPYLIGGKQLHRWQRALHDFMIAEAKSIGASVIWFVARKGWIKKYPMCKEIGTIYEFKLDPPVVT